MNSLYAKAFFAHSGVSILVLLELPREQCHDPPLYFALYEVSILVLLELPREHCNVPIPGRGITSFNPCFIGIAAWTRIGIASFPKYYSFNPCFIGIAAWTSKAAAVPIAHDSFNPCFIGIAAWTLFSWYPPMLYNRVSILVLLELPRERYNGGIDAGKSTKFQSLFYWNCRVNSLCLHS